MEMAKMKPWVRRLGVIVGIIGLIAFGHTEGWGVDWKYYGTNEDGSYFYDTESMTRSPKELIEVWVQSAYSEKGISHWVREGGKGFQDLDYSLIWLGLNCVERSARYLRIVFYSKNGNVFHPMDNDEWHFIAPDSMTETLYKEVCK